MKKILIVEDNLVNLKVVKISLELSGYEVRTAQHAEMAFEVLKNFYPTFILMDIKLPGVDGLEITRKLKSDARYKEMIVIAITAYAMKGDKEKALAAGCDEYLAKPFAIEELSLLLDKHLQLEAEDA